MKKRGQLKDIVSITNSRLARKFALYTVSLSIFIAITISVMFVYKNYHNDINNLNKELSEIEHSLKSSLTLHLWQMNLNALDIMLTDLLMNKHIVYIELLDEKGNLLLEKGNRPIHDIIKKSISLYFPQSDEKNIYLGELNYTATTKEIFEENKHSVFTAIVWIFIFFIILSMVILFIYWESTVKYLLAIKEYTNKIRLGGYRKEIGSLLLDRPVGKNGHKDELDELVNAINEMHHEVIEKYTAIEYQSLHDSLTGLPNRRMIHNLIADTIERCKAVNGYGILLDIDLDNFKLLNESIGHTAGDNILCEIADRLLQTSKEEFQPARISGDEFLVLQNRIISSREKAKEIAESFSKQVLSNISKDMAIDGYHLKNTACIGIAIIGPETHHGAIVKQADNALYHAKSKGPGNISIFEPVMQQKIDRRLELEQLIDKAIEKDLIYIYYQPKYDSQQNIRSAEALVRMYDEEGGIISPGEFIPILEETGAIVEIGDHIIKKVFGFINTYNNEIKKSGIKSIAINVSPTQYKSTGFVDRVIAFSQQFDIDPKMIIFEITEEVVASSIDKVVDVMHQLTKYGFRFSIDDFGTGYSSLRYLKNLPLTELKIDKSFVDDITIDSRATGIVKTIIDMAHNLNLDVVAEGVESKEQFDILTQYKCEFYQGYLFSKPVPEYDFFALLQQEIVQSVGDC